MFRGSYPCAAFCSLFATLSLMGMAHVVLMPVFAAEVLQGGPYTLGFLMSAAGVGALISSLSLALRKSVRGLSKMLPIAAAIFGAGLVLFGMSRLLSLSLLLMVLTGTFCIAGAAWFWTQLRAIRKEMRPIYIQLGLVPASEVVEEQAGN